LLSALYPENQQDANFLASEQFNLALQSALVYVQRSSSCPLRTFDANGALSGKLIGAGGSVS
jgi:hypothetical protein